jgi:DNA repair photolyase
MSRGGRRTSNLLLADPSRIERKVERAFNVEHQKDVIENFIFTKVPIHFGGMSDPFSTPEITLRSLKILQILDQIDYPVIISTKNTNVFFDEKIYMQILMMKNVVIQISISTVCDNYAKIIEPNASTPTDRLQAIERFSSQGKYVFARIQPIFPHRLIEVENELIPMLSQAGVKHVILEFLKLPVESNLNDLSTLTEALKWDIINYYKFLNAEKIGREWVLPAKTKWEMLQPLLDRIHQEKMTYGLADYGLYHLSDTDCCCGVDKINGFSNWFHHNYSYQIKHVKNGVLKFDENLKTSIPSNTISMYINSNSRLKENDTLFGHLKSKWNRPGTANSPDSYLGVEWSGDRDENGNCIYYKSNI